MSDKDWLQGLKAGDEVAICHVLFGGSVWHEFREVQRRTATQIVLGPSSRYRVSDGRCLSSSYGALVEPTPEVKQQEAERQQRNTLANKIESVTWRDLPLATLRAVDAALQSKPTTGEVETI